MKYIDQFSNRCKHGLKQDIEKDVFKDQQLEEEKIETTTNDKKEKQDCKIDTRVSTNIKNIQEASVGNDAIKLHNAILNIERTTKNASKPIK